MYDMTIQLHMDGGKHLYEQIYEHIKREIREGKLLTGERLPSTRSMAEYLQVARSTVDTAYGQLLSEGYIESRPYRGYFVCKMDELFRLEDVERRTASGPVSADKGNRSAGSAGFASENGGNDYRNGQEAEEGAVSGVESRKSVQYDFSPHAIDMSAFPFNVWMRITKNILSESDSSLFAQGEPQGDLVLRTTISRYLHSSRGVNCSPEQIIVGAGNDYLLLLLEKILGRHVRIAMENPTYKRAYRIFQSFAYTIVAVDMDENGMSAAGLESENVTAAYVMPSHQFPTGTVMPIGRRAELLRWADGEESRYLIEDDYDSEFRYRGKPIPSLQASDRRGKVIYIGTFSKAIAPAIRVSYMVLPERLLERYRKECFFYSTTVSRIDQRILNEFIQNGHFERYLNKMRKIYRGKHELLLELLQPFKKAFCLSGENAGLHLLLTARDGRTEEELIAGARDLGVKVYGMSDSFIQSNPTQKATILLGYGGLSEEQIRQGMDLLKKAWL